MKKNREGVMQMMVTIGIYLRRWQRILRRTVMDPRVHTAVQGGAYLLGGFCLSAASLSGYPQPLTLGLLCALTGWPAVLLSLGGAAGYLIFWGAAGAQGLVWLGTGLMVAILLGERPFMQRTVLLMPILAALIVGGSGLGFQLGYGQTVPVPMYFLRVAAAGLTAGLFRRLTVTRDPVLQWVAVFVAVLALAQLLPFSYIGLGYIAAGFITAAWAFPAAALAGLALDLAQITPVPMTAVLCLAWFTRLIPGQKRYWRWGAVGCAFAVVMALSGKMDLQPLPGLLLGGLVGQFFTGKTELFQRRSDTGIIQVRLELVSTVLQQTRQMLLDVQEHPIDEQALICRAADRACGSCSYRAKCTADPKNLPVSILRRPLGSGVELPLLCRKSGRLLQELKCSQEQLRTIRADRDRREEYRWAVAQQYGFLSEYLMEQADDLPRRRQPQEPRYQPQLSVYAAPREGVSGDRCVWFAGTRCRYYIVLCDGMGTGKEAAHDGKVMGELLKKLLSAGFPPEYALRSVNSLCALQGRAGAVTMDLAELELDSGKATVYKWGAAPSYLVSHGTAVKIGSAVPPPGLSVTDGRETAQKLSLKKGELLVLLSDGAGGEGTLRRALEGFDEPPGELAARILELSRIYGSDDATVAVVRLTPMEQS